MKNVTPKKRNPVAAANPQLRKGGVHGKTRKAERKAQRQQLRRRLPGLE